MLMMTRTGDLLEVGDGDANHLSIDTMQIASASLCTERALCGRIRQVLALSFRNGSQCVRIESGSRELAALHQAITEIMLQSPRAPLHH